MKDLWEEQGFERTGSPGTKVRTGSCGGRTLQARARRSVPEARATLAGRGGGGGVTGKPRSVRRAFSMRLRSFVLHAEG